MKKTEIKKRDREFSAKVRARGECEWGRVHKGRLECAHIFSRRHRAMRWDEDNALCLCTRHHFMAHHNPLLFSEFVKRYIGIEKFNALLLKAKTVIGKYESEERT